MKKYVSILIISLILCVGLYAQTDITDYSELTSSPIKEHNITINKNVDFQTALKIMEAVCLRVERKNIINTSSYTGDVPFQINNIYWKDAFVQLVKDVGLVIEERPGVYYVKDDPSASTAAAEASEYSIHDKMVRINATFLDVDRMWMNSVGINWNTLSHGRVNGSLGLNTYAVETGDNATVRVPSMGASYNRTDSWRGGTIELSALLDFIETNNKGTILARPTITVLNGKEGYVQVGTDFSVKTKDENGNTTDEFFSTGIMLTVNPIIIEEDGFEVVFLQSSVENSGVTSPDDATSIRIGKNTARSDIMLFDGEETVIAGLISTQTTHARAGVPILKDLPWWVFGLKYIFGYTQETTQSREMVVILKVEIVSPAKQRILEDIKLREAFDKMRDDFKEIDKELLSKPEPKEIEDEETVASN